MDQPTTEQRGVETSETQATEPRVRAAWEPRLFGTIPPTLALCLGVGGVILGVVLLATGSVVAGAIWVLAGVSLLALGLESARRWPASALPRVRAAAAAFVRRLGVAWVSAGAWSDASQRRFALRRELRNLRKRRKAEISILGAAAYREDAEEMGTLRERIAELDRQIERCEGAMDEAVQRARERVQRKRAEVQPTRPQSA